MSWSPRGMSGMNNKRPLAGSTDDRVVVFKASNINGRDTNWLTSLYKHYCLLKKSWRWPCRIQEKSREKCWYQGSISNEFYVIDPYYKQNWFKILYQEEGFWVFRSFGSSSELLCSLLLDSDTPELIKTKERNIWQSLALRDHPIVLQRAKDKDLFRS
jgi:hypothetical protein